MSNLNVGEIIERAYENARFTKTASSGKEGVLKKVLAAPGRGLRSVTAEAANEVIGNSASAYKHFKKGGAKLLQGKTLPHAVALTGVAAAGYGGKKYLDYRDSQMKYASYEEGLEKEAGIKDLVSNVYDRITGKNKSKGTNMAYGGSKAGYDARQAVKASRRTPEQMSELIAANKARKAGGNPVNTGQMHGPTAADAAKQKRYQDIKSGMKTNTPTKTVQRATYSDASVRGAMHGPDLPPTRSATMLGPDLPKGYKSTDKGSKRTLWSRAQNQMARPGRAIMAHGARVQAAGGAKGSGAMNAIKRGYGAALSNKYIGHGLIPGAALAVGAGAYAYNRNKKQKSASDKEKLLARAKRYASAPGRKIQSIGAGFTAKGGAKGSGKINAIRRGVGRALSNKYVAHGALPGAALAAGAGAYAYSKKNKKASLEAEIFNNTLFDINFESALAEEIQEWKEANFDFDYDY